MSQGDLLSLPPLPRRMWFDGPEYEPEHDRVRLTGQALRVRDAMKDGGWRTVEEISALTGDPEPSVSAQLRHLRKERFGSHVVNIRYRGARANALYEYQVLPPDPEAPRREHGAESKRVIQALRAELDAARKRIRELEAQR